MRIGLDSTLAYFVQAAKRYPLLTPERELEVTTAWRDRGDRAALEVLAGSHLRLVLKIARGFAGYGLPLVDLIGEGNVGLMQAAERFDPARGFRFATYAMWWIRAAMHEHVLRSWSLVRIGTTTAQRRLFFNLRRLKLRLEAFEQGDLAPQTVTAIAKCLDVTERETLEMNRRLDKSDASLSVTRRGTNYELLELLPDDRPSQETVVGEVQEARWRHKVLDEVLNELDQRTRAIIVERWLKEKPSTLEELARRFAVSPERIRQIEVRAISKMTHSVTVIQ